MTKPQRPGAAAVFPETSDLGPAGSQAAGRCQRRPLRRAFFFAFFLPRFATPREEAALRFAFFAFLAFFALGFALAFAFFFAGLAFAGAAAAGEGAAGVYSGGAGGMG